MKILCDVVVHNRQHPSSSYKSAKSTLALGFHPPGGKSDAKLFVILFTARSKTGTRYQLTDNLKQVFSRFVEEGKFTLSLISPEVDLQIRSKDVIVLKNFLRSLNVALKGDIQDREKLRLSSLSVTPLTTKSHPATKLSIAKRSDYPIKGFPKTLTHLEIIGLERSRMDSQILYLKHLTHLNLSDNSITEIPKPFGELHLIDVNLSGNVLGSEIKGCDWKWLEGMGVTKSLVTLDLSNNYLKSFPLNLTKLQKLNDLNLDFNSIRRIPFAIRNLRTLKSLSMERNELESLPNTLEMLSFDHINISQNDFPHHTDDIPQHEFSFQPRICLFEIAARVVVRQSIPYAHPSSHPTLQWHTVPWIVADLLDGTPVCSCGNPCFDAKIYEKCSAVQLRYKCITSNADRNILADCVFCSRRCFEKRILN
ncbi:leucine-rich repeat protein 1 [Phlebotomus papatasi]|uniref:PIF1/LRR1 pleckstrin homology domain-containing protein n=1 Tax=Phlebotomus papatasi TaxID=29031 RepID=A0A1B0D5S6_PHLPP|nr:leucine-rich repeat protein 1 [Phlebotomus papatasi]